MSGLLQRLVHRSAKIHLYPIASHEIELPEDDIRNPASIASQVGEQASGIICASSAIFGFNSNVISSAPSLPRIIPE